MATANEFPLDPVDGALAELEKADGSIVVYKYSQANAAWNIVGVNGGTTEFVTTSDVQTTADQPTKPTGFTSFDTMQDLGYLTNQKLVNWYLAEKVLTNAEDVSEILWISEDPPVDKEYLFWFDTTRLELLVYYNEQWFPVSIPPGQMEDLRAILERELAGVAAEITRVELNLSKEIERQIWFGDEQPTEGSYKYWLKTDTSQYYIKEGDYWNISYRPVIFTNGPTPPSFHIDFDKPLVDGDLWHNKETDSLYVWANHMWHPTGKDLDLQGVLENGQVATKGIILRSPDALDSDADAIILAPTISRITLAAEEKENFLPTFQLIERGNNASETRTAEFELDEGRLDINMTEQQDEVHFRFRDEEELILRHRSNPAGASELFGKLKVDPGTKDNEVVTHGQLATIEEELEQLAPSLERGVWTYTPDPNPLPGHYTLIKEMLSPENQQTICDLEYTECLLSAGSDPAAQSNCNRAKAECEAAIIPEGKIVTTNKFSEADQILFNEYDMNGVLHEFRGIDDDHLMDLFNEDDDAFGVFDILEHGGGLFNVDVLSSRGEAIDAAKLKIFKHQGSVDFDSYVRNTGDTMTGELIIDPSSGAQAATFKAGLAAAGSRADIITVKNSDRDVIFYVDEAKDVGVHPDYEPTGDKHLVPKGWADLTYGGPAKYAWEFFAPMKDQNPSPGTCHYDEADIRNTGVFRFHHKPLIGREFEPLASGERVMYKRSTGNAGVYLSVWYWLSNVGQWRFKGSGPVQEIIQYPNHLRVKLYTADCIANGTIGSNAVYHVTVSGFF